MVSGVNHMLRPRVDGSSAPHGNISMFELEGLPGLLQLDCTLEIEFQNSDVQSPARD